jgi:hypothetical protein
MGFGRRAWAAVTGAAMVVTLAACGGQALGTAGAAHVGGPVATKNTDSPGRAAPDGTFTTLEGKRAAVSSFRGSPALLWFISGGCASCAVSIPAVAQRLASFARARVHVLVLGLYGAFDQGARGLTELHSFGRAAAGPAFSNPAWTWGLASAGLTAAYDPEGVPDDYFLLDGAGQVGRLPQHGANLDDGGPAHPRELLDRRPHKARVHRGPRPKPPMTHEH